MPILMIALTQITEFYAQCRETWKLIFKSHSWWHTPVIPAFRKKRQEDCLQIPGRSDLHSPGWSGYIARLRQNYSKTNKENTRIHLKREVNSVSWCQPKILSLELSCTTDSSDLVIFVPLIEVTRLRATDVRTLEGTCKMQRWIPGLCATSGSDSGAGLSWRQHSYQKQLEEGRVCLA